MKRQDDDKASGLFLGSEPLDSAAHERRASGDRDGKDLGGHGPKDSGDSADEKDADGVDSDGADKRDSDGVDGDGGEDSKDNDGKD